MSHVTQSKRPFKEYGVNDKLEAMMKEQIVKSTSEEVTQNKNQASDSVTSANAPAKSARAAAAASATNKKVNERHNCNLC